MSLFYKTILNLMYKKCIL